MDKVNHLECCQIMCAQTRPEVADLPIVRFANVRFRAAVAVKRRQCADTVEKVLTARVLGLGVVLIALRINILESFGQRHRFSETFSTVSTRCGRSSKVNAPSEQWFKNWSCAVRPKTALSSMPRQAILWPRYRFIRVILG